MCSIFYYIRISSNIFYRKLFGDGSINPATPSRRMILTKKTTYHLMVKQGLQTGEDTNGQSSEVSIRWHLLQARLLTQHPGRTT